METHFIFGEEISIGLNENGLIVNLDFVREFYFGKEQYTHELYWFSTEDDPQAIQLLKAYEGHNGFATLTKKETRLLTAVESCSNDRFRYAIFDFAELFRQLSSKKKLKKMFAKDAMIIFLYCTIRELGKGFHPDHDGEDYANPDSSQFLDSVQAEQFDICIKYCFKICEKHKVDIYEVSATLRDLIVDEE